MGSTASVRSSATAFAILVEAILIGTTLAGAARAGTLPVFAGGEDAVQAGESAPPAIVIGFVGGFVRHDRPHHGPIELAQRIQSTVPKGTHVEVFENRHRARARAVILRLLDTDHDGSLSDEEKSRARIILYGHSWGAAAAVQLARDLRREHIPVLLTAQVDSVATWHEDSVIPDNVAEAVNFYQPHGLIHGRAEIRAADSSKTEILGNYLTDYKKQPVLCTGYPWHNRIFTPGHMQSECDPKVWSRVEDLVLQRLAVQPISGSIAQTKDLSETVSRK